MYSWINGIKHLQELKNKQSASNNAVEAQNALIPKIVIIMEDFRSAKKLTNALEALPGVQIQYWIPSQGCICPHKKPDMNAVYYSRLSPSGRTRGHSNAFTFGMRILEWLEYYGAKVINGLQAARLDSSKFTQWLEMDRAGFPPRDRILVCNEHGANAAVSTHLHTPFLPKNENDIHGKDPRTESWYLKPDHGGSGVGVRRFTNSSEIRRLSEVRSKKEEMPLKNAPHDLYVFESAIDGVLSIANSKNGVIMYRTFYRAEFVGKKLLYVVRVHAVDHAKNMCPCEDVHSDGVTFFIVERPEREFGQHRFSRFLRLCNNLMETNSIDICAIEFAFNRSKGIVPYDINCNTNYNRGAELHAGIQQGGYEEIALYLYKSLLKSKGKVIENGEDCSHDGGSDSGGDYEDAMGYVMDKEKESPSFSNLQIGWGEMDDLADINDSIEPELKSNTFSSVMVEDVTTENGENCKHHTNTKAAEEKSFFNTMSQIEKDQEDMDVSEESLILDITDPKKAAESYKKLEEKEKRKKLSSEPIFPIEAPQKE